MYKFFKAGLSAVLSIVLAAGSMTVPAWADTDLNTVSAESEASASLTGTDSSVLKTWTFDTDAQNWNYDSGWDYQYDGDANTSVTYDGTNKRLEMNVDYSNNSDVSWSQPTLLYSESGMVLTGAKQFSFDFWYNSSSMSAGSFTFALWSDDFSSSSVSATEAADDGGLMKEHVTLSFDAVTAASADRIALKVVGNMTDYSGSIYFDNMEIAADAQSDNDVNSTVTVNSGNPSAVSNGSLSTYLADNTTNESTALADSIALADPNATDAVKAAYVYLKAVGESSSVIYGHQNDTWKKAGSSALSNSDTKDVTGSISGVIGIDALSLTGSEYSVSDYNKAYGGSLPDTSAGRVAVAAALTNANISDGALITLSAHMPNFSAVTENASYNAATDPSYAKYDFSGYSPNVLTGDVMKQILPGGTYNDRYNAYLDMIADFASQIKGAVIFRPFHENTGSWFWWGAAFCSSETFKSVYRYTVDYLKNEKNIHNFLYAYGPGSESANETEYSERYPGDNYVDLVGFDMYDIDPKSDDAGYTYPEQLKTQAAMVASFAGKHGKLMAVTECGMGSSTADPGDSQTVLHKTGNKQKDWYNKVLNALSSVSGVSYMLLWANFGKSSGFYTPYVDSVNANGTLHGHEMLDNFISFFNDGRTIFACDQKKALTDLLSCASGVSASSPSDSIEGWFDAPTAGERILSATSCTATLTAEPDSAKNISMLLKGENSVTVPVTVNGRTVKGEITAELLSNAGKSADGSISLIYDGRTIASQSQIVGIEAPAEDPYEIDGFENYYGQNTLLNNAWSVNKASGNTISLTLSNGKNEKNARSFGMDFTYDETSDGWAGATIKKTVDWSDCNALQFYTVPDGNNQKVVIQITANNTVYEAYLNSYEDYRDTTDPMLVTIPFSEFCQRDTEGHPTGGLLTDDASISSFGLWVNAVADSSAVKNGRVSGSIFYDSITAVSTDKTAAAFEKYTLDEGAVYTIVSSGNTKLAVDVRNASLLDNAAIQLADRNGKDCQKFTALKNADGTWELSNYASGKRIDVRGNSQENGAALGTHTSNGTNAQKWNIRRNSDGTFTIINAHSGKAVDVPGADFKSGNALQMYQDNGTAAQKFIFVRVKDPDAKTYEGNYTLASSVNSSFLFDIKSGSKASNANVQLWKANGTPAQSFIFTYAGDGCYSILNKGSGLALDVSNGIAEDCRNVQQYTFNGTNAQRWKIEDNGDGTVTILSAINGHYALDALDGAAERGTNIQIYHTNGTPAQRWVLSKS